MRKNGLSNPVNLLTIAVLLLTFCVCGSYAGIFFIANADAPFDPFGQTSLPTRVVLASPLPPTETPLVIATNTSFPEPTATIAATATLTATATLEPEAPPTRIGAELTLTPGGEDIPPTRIGDGDTPTPTAAGTETATSVRYRLQQGTPLLISHATQGCNWMGIAGQVFDADGVAEIGVFLQIEGPGISTSAFTGSAPQYGDGGYEIQLADAPAATSGEFSITVLDDEFNPASDTVSFDTSASCDSNLILINFERVTN